MNYFLRCERPFVQRTTGHRWFPTSKGCNADHWWFPVSLSAHLNKQARGQWDETPWRSCDLTRTRDWTKDQAITWMNDKLLTDPQGTYFITFCLLKTQVPSIKKRHMKLSSAEILHFTSYYLMAATYYLSSTTNYLAAITYCLVVAAYYVAIATYHLATTSYYLVATIYYLAAATQHLTAATYHSAAASYHPMAATLYSMATT